MALDATIAGTSANSFVDLATAEAYLADQFATGAWDALADADKEKCLIQATREINYHRFHGWRATAEQALNFPRLWPGYQTTIGAAIADADEPVHTEALYIPFVVQHATCEQALWIAQNATRGGATSRQHLQAQGVASFRMGDLSETFTGAGKSLGGRKLCPAAQDLLKRWINKTGLLTAGEREDVSEYWLPLV